MKAAPSLPPMLPLILLLLSIGPTRAAPSANEAPAAADGVGDFALGRGKAVGIAVRARRETSLEYENRVCECVPYYQCQGDGNANVDGEGVIDIRVGSGSFESPTASRRACEHYLSVCCLPPDISRDRPTAGGQNGSVLSPIDQQGGQGEQGLPATQRPPDRQGGAGGGPNGRPHVERGCGYRNPNGVGFRITGNYRNEANFAEFPWMVAVLRQESFQGNVISVFQCGGSLIHRRVVLTVAHCVFGKSASQLTIRAGEWDTQTSAEPLLHQDREVSIILTHPDFKKNVLHNDFALLLLTRPLDIADNVETTCLPQGGENFDGSRCFATGWGKNQFGEKEHYQVILKAVELPIVPRDRCQNSLRSTRLGKYFKLHESFTCAGGESGVDTCTGDGGSPLVCPLPGDPSRYTQVGIVAWGIGCGEDNVPGVYADLTRARGWIDESLSNYNIEAAPYTSSAASSGAARRNLS